MKYSLWREMLQEPPRGVQEDYSPLVENINWGLIKDKLKEPFVKAWNWLAKKAKGDDGAADKAKRIKEKAQKDLKKIIMEYDRKIEDLDKRIKKEAKDKGISLEKSREDNRLILQRVQDWYCDSIEYVIGTVLEALSLGREETIWDASKKERDNAYQYDLNRIDQEFKTEYNSLRSLKSSGVEVGDKIEKLRKEYKDKINALDKKFGYEEEY